jgi:DNA replication initiation complex subunit (GINS family)
MLILLTAEEQAIYDTLVNGGIDETAALIHVYAIAEEVEIDSIDDYEEIEGIENVPDEEQEETKCVTKNSYIEEEENVQIAEVV